MVDMKKFIVLAFLLIFCAASATAQYVRKLKEPDFFIPAGEAMHKAEKLPEIKMIPKEENKKTEEDEVATKTESPKEVISQPKVASSLYEKKEIPVYKSKYNQYIDDVMRFYSDRVMPKNEQLQKDLAEMNSDEHITVTAPAPQKLTSKEMGEFYAIYQKMLNN